MTRRIALKSAGVGLATAALAEQGEQTVMAQDTTPIAGSISRSTVEAALPKLAELAETAVRDGGVPGLTMAIIYQDDVVLEAAHGVRSTESGEPVTLDTVFQLASVSKAIASTVISAVVGTGAATWDDPVLEHLPDFLLSDAWATRELTITDYLCHRSGLGGDAGGDLERVGYGQQQISERLRYLALASSPRTTFAYSNWALTIGGLAAAAAAGMTWEEAAAELLYAPLGMTSTGSRYADFEANANRAVMHAWLDDSWRPAFTYNPDPISPSDGVSSNVPDLVQWMRLVMNDGVVDGVAIISADPLLAARVPLMSLSRSPFTGQPTFYGRGWGVSFDTNGDVILEHAGAFAQGARTIVTINPAQKLGIVVLTNAFPTGLPEALADSLFDLVRHGELTQDWLANWNGFFEEMSAAFGASGAPFATLPAAPTPALPAHAYTGVYANAYVGQVTIAGADDALTISLGPEPREFAMTHFDRDTFTYQVDPEPPAALTGATFIIGPDGVATAVMLDYFAGNNQGMLPRAEAV